MNLLQNYMFFSHPPNIHNFLCTKSDYLERKLDLSLLKISIVSYLCSTHALCTLGRMPCMPTDARLIRPRTYALRAQILMPDASRSLRLISTVRYALFRPCDTRRIAQELQGIN